MTQVLKGWKAVKSRSLTIRFFSFRPLSLVAEPFASLAAGMRRPPLGSSMLANGSVSAMVLVKDTARESIAISVGGPGIWDQYRVACEGLQTQCGCFAWRTGA